LNAHATASSYDLGWSCDRGYRAFGESCVSIDIPENAYLVDAAYGPGWRCERGYQAVAGACLPVQLPRSAHLDYSGNDWECDPPYRKRRDGCELP
jgi:hypothetical protein